MELYAELINSETMEYKVINQEEAKKLGWKKYELETSDGHFYAIGKTPKNELRELVTELNSLEYYLAHTDWYVTRFIDTGEPMPAEVKQKRQKARDEISRLREELEKL